METLKIIALTLLSELFIYYLITIYLKWSMGFEYSTSRIFDPLVPWIDAIYFEKFSDGFDRCRKQMEGMVHRHEGGFNQDAPAERQNQI